MKHSSSQFGFKVLVTLMFFVCAPKIGVAQTGSGASLYSKTVLIPTASSITSVKPNSLGKSVAVSQDGLVAVAGMRTADSIGAVVVWKRNSRSSLWKQDTVLQDASVKGYNQGFSLALSPNGNNLLTGGIKFTTSNGITTGDGKVWAWAYSSSGWYLLQLIIQPFLANPSSAEFGYSIAMGKNANGLLAVIGAPGDENDIGSASVFALRQEANLKWRYGANFNGYNPVGKSRQGEAVAISPEGNFVAVGGPSDSMSTNPTLKQKHGAVWLWQNQGNYSSWTYGDTANGKLNVGYCCSQGSSVAFSNGGGRLLVGNNTAEVSMIGNGGRVDILNSNGQSYPTWTEADSFMVRPSNALLGSSTAISPDSKLAVTGAPGAYNDTGATWIWDLSDTARPALRIPALRISEDSSSRQGTSVAISADEKTLIVGAPKYNKDTGAVFAFDFLPRSGYQVLAMRGESKNILPKPQPDDTDWSGGNHKTACPSKLMATGLSTGRTAVSAVASLLCGAGGNNPSDPVAGGQCSVMNQAQNVGGILSCPTGTYVAGISRTTSDRYVADMLCCKLPSPSKLISGNSREVGPFGQCNGDCGESVLPIDDWDNGSYKAACGEGRYMTGIRLHSQWPYAKSIFCDGQPLPSP